MQKLEQRRWPFESSSIIASSLSNAMLFFPHPFDLGPQLVNACHSAHVACLEFLLMMVIINDWEQVSVRKTSGAKHLLTLRIANAHQQRAVGFIRDRICSARGAHFGPCLLPLRGSSLGLQSFECGKIIIREIPGDWSYPRHLSEWITFFHLRCSLSFHPPCPHSR